MSRPQVENAQFGALTIEQGIEPEQIEPVVRKKALLQEEIELLQAEVQTLKDNRKATLRHIDVKDLPEEERFRQLSTHSKHFIDTIKIIAYRAETSMANVLRETMSHSDEARCLLRALYTTEVDLLPNHEQKTLTVRLHHLGQRTSDEVIRKLCDELNATETLFPRSDLRLIFELGTAHNLRDPVI